MKKNNKYFCDGWGCGQRLNKNTDHIQEPNPYAEEINGKIVIEDLCKSCYHEACMDI